MKKLTIFCIFALLSTISYAQSSSDILKNLSNGKKPHIKGTYSFSASMKYQISTTQKQGSKMNFKYLLPATGEDAVGFEISDVSKNNKILTRSVFDIPNKAMVMVMEDSKMAMVMPMDIGKYSSEAQKNPNYQASVPKKTGKTKTILGYKCEEWASENSDNKSSIWIADVSNLPSKGFYEMMQQSMSNNGKISLPKGMNGFPLEIDTINKKNSETMQMLCTEINANAPSKITTVGYNVVGGN